MIGRSYCDIMLLASIEVVVVFSVGGKEEHEHKYVPWSHLRIRTKVWKHGNLTQLNVMLGYLSLHSPAVPMEGWRCLSIS